MANTSSAKKAYIQSEQRRKANAARKSALKTSIKKLLTALSQPEAGTQLDTLLSTVSAQLARARSKKVMKRNTASRVLSRLAKKVAVTKRTETRA